MTIQDAMTLIRTSTLPSSIHYFYVVDDENRLVGVVPTRRLLSAEPDHKVARRDGRTTWWRSRIGPPC